jgi:hypothetical protein
MQKLANPEIARIEYQQGLLQGYEVRAYLLEKLGRRCTYCGATDTPLEVEHIIPRSRGGSDRVGNLTLACRPCNLAKGNQTAAEFGHPQVQAQVQAPLKDAAAVNVTRQTLRSSLQALGLTVLSWTGGRTRWNRSRFAVEKSHALDALCVGDLAGVANTALPVLVIRATGRGKHCRTNVNSSGFPRGYLSRRKRVHGFQTGDLVCAVVSRGKRAGTHVGRVVVRASGSFCVGISDGISWRCCTLLQRADGYDYSTSVDKKGGPAVRAHG